MDSGAIAYIRQHKALGLGHAVWCARRLVGNEPFALLLPDMIMKGEKGCLKGMVELFEHSGANVVAVRTFGDVARVREIAKTAKNAAVIGGGVLGLEPTQFFWFFVCTISGIMGGAAIAAQLLDRPAERRPEGVFCANDTLAFGFMDAARHTFGLRIPEDIAVVGFDDVPMAAAASFQLTSVRQDIEGLAAEAVDRLVERMSDPTRPARSQTLPVELVERRTCRR